MKEKVIEVEFIQDHGLYKKGEKTNMAESTAAAIASKGIVKFEGGKTKKESKKENEN